jgi:hypothetical protein
MTRGAYNKKRGWTIPKDENPKDKGYLVKYPDGYVSWCPKAQFESQGFPIEKRLNTKLWGFLGFMLQWAKFGLRDVGLEIAKKVDAEEAKKK